MRPSSCRRRLDSGMRCAPSPDWRTPAAGPATCRSRLSTGGCSRPRTHRLPSGAIWTTAPRGEPSWRSRRVPRPIAQAESASRIAISASSSSAPSTRRCWTTSRRSTADRCRFTPAPASARRPVRSTRLSRSRTTWSGARSVRSCTTPRRIASSSFASSIRRWAAARFWSPPAGFSLAAYESALVRHGGCHSSDIGESERVSIRRTIAERCLYGVDLNPMAVQLARLSLWLATLAADRPLSFLDHRLQVGDSLLGTWLAHVRQPPSLRRRRGSSDSLPLFDSDAVAECGPGGAAAPVLVRVAQRHRRTGPGEGARVRRVDRPRCVALAVETDRARVVCSVVRTGRHRGARVGVRIADRCRADRPERASAAHDGTLSGAGRGARRGAAVLSLGARVS